MVRVIGRTDYEGYEFTCNSNRRPCFLLVLAVSCVLLDVELKGSNKKDATFYKEETRLELTDLSWVLSLNFWPLLEYLEI